MRLLASQGHTILVGRGAGALTQGVPGGVHVRVVAPRDWRIGRMMETQHLSRAEADSQIRRMDRDRERFVRQYFHVEAPDPTGYDLILNHARMDQDTMADLLAHYVRLRDAA